MIAPIRMTTLDRWKATAIHYTRCDTTRPRAVDSALRIFSSPNIDRADAAADVLRVALVMYHQRAVTDPGCAAEAARIAQLCLDKRPDGDELFWGGWGPFGLSVEIDIALAVHRAHADTAQDALQAPQMVGDGQIHQTAPDRPAARESAAQSRRAYDEADQDSGMFFSPIWGAVTYPLVQFDIDNLPF